MYDVTENLFILSDNNFPSCSDLVYMCILFDTYNFILWSFTTHLHNCFKFNLFSANGKHFLLYL